MSLQAASEEKFKLCSAVYQSLGANNMINSWTNYLAGTQLLWHLGDKI